MWHTHAAYQNFVSQIFFFFCKSVKLSNFVLSLRKKERILLMCLQVDHVVLLFCHAKIEFDKLMWTHF